VVRQRGEIDGLRTLVRKYAKLSKEILGVLHGSDGSDTGLARQEILEGVRDQVGYDAQDKVYIEGLPQLSEEGTLHEKAVTLIRGLEDVRGRIGRAEDGEESETVQGRLARLEVGMAQLVEHEAKLTREQTTIQCILNVVDWCTTMHIMRETVAQWIQNTVTDDSAWPFRGVRAGWRWNIHSNGSGPGQGWYCITLAHIPSGGGTMAWHTLYQGQENWTDGVQFMHPDNQTAGAHTLINYAAPQPIPELPSCEWAELAIFATCGPINGYGAVGAEGYYKVWSNEAQGQLLPVRPPITDMVEAVVPGKGRTDIADVMRAVAWRALIGTYTAPTT
jgi:hypothetical protein